MVCPSSLSYAQNTTPCLYVERLNPVAIYLLFTFRNHTTLPTAQVSCKSWAPIGLLAYQKIPILQKMYHSLTHCCAWPAESRSDLHNERSWLVIWARPTDIPQSSSTCCSHVLLGRPGGRFQSAAGGVSVTQCGYHQLTVALAARQVDKRDQTTNDVCQRWETVDQVTSFSAGLQHLTPCHTILCQEYNAVPAYGQTESCCYLLHALSTFRSHTTQPTVQVSCKSWAWWINLAFVDARRCQVKT